MREREIESIEKCLGQAGIRTQDLPDTSQMLLPLSHWAHGRGAAHKLHIAALCGGLSQIPTDSLSLGGWTEMGLFDKYTPTSISSLACMCVLLQSSFASSCRLPTWC